MIMNGCVFYDEWWNDSEQRNYILHECGNPENTGGVSAGLSEIDGHYLKNPHSERTYSY
jgi:hypothetical protein